VEQILRDCVGVSPLYALVFLAVVSSAFGFFTDICYDDLPAFVSISIRALGIIIATLALSDSLTEIGWSGASSNSDSETFFTYGAPIALVGFLLSCWRPCFQVVVLLYYDLARRLFAQAAGVEWIPTDYANVGQIVIGSIVVVRSSAYFAPVGRDRARRHSSRQ